MKTIKGEIETEKRERAEKFTSQLDEFTKQYELISAFICKKTKDLQARAHELADDYYAVGTEIKRFSHLLKCTEVP